MDISSPVKIFFAAAASSSSSSSSLEFILSCFGIASKTFIKNLLRVAKKKEKRIRKEEEEEEEATMDLGKKVVDCSAHHSAGTDLYTKYKYDPVNPLSVGL